MCGICGTAGIPPDMKRLKQMNRMMYHRGPDDEGYYTDKDAEIQLAMRRLAIIDVSGGRQPLYNEDASIILVCNGEIYNYRELRKLLENRGHVFSTNSDSETVLHGYEEFGIRVTDRLDGMFAFAVWDRNKRGLFCARDRFGIKPFYYFMEGNAFYFASEQKAILNIMPSPPSLSVKCLVRRFTAGFPTQYDSMFEELKQLPPGCTLFWKNASLEIEHYWKPTFGELKNHGGHPEILLDKFSSAVKSHMVSDVPVGLTLSGGLDSSAVAAVMNSGRNDFTAYTVGYGVPGDEIPYASAVAEKFGFKHQAGLFSPQETAENLPRILWHLEEPLANVTLFTTWNWARFISGEKKVTLIGEGADELFGGYIYHRIFSGAISKLPLKIKLFLYRKAFLLAGLNELKNIFGAGSEGSQFVESVYHDEIESLFKGPGSDLEKMLAYDLKYELANNQLLRVDRLSMAFSLEARVPFLGRDFSEFALSLPASCKIKRARQKFLLRESFRGILPGEILNRPKTGRKGSQGITGLFFEKALNSAFERLLKSRKDFLSEFFDVDYLSDFFKGKVFTDPVFGLKIRQKSAFLLLSFFIFHFLYIDNDFRKSSDIPFLKEIL